MSTVLDVAIGIFYLYLLLALLVTTAQEIVATLASSRANNLYDAIESMLRRKPKGATANDDDLKAKAEVKDLVQALYDHPLLKNLAKPAIFGRLGTLKRPSYIPSKTFALALLDVLRSKTTLSEATGARQLLLSASETIEQIKNNDQLKRQLELLVTDVAKGEDDLDKRAAKISEQIETWFNDRMARVAGWYKRRAQCWSLGLAFAAAVCFNADTLHVAKSLWQDGALRAATVASAQAYHDTHDASATQPSGSVEQLGKLALAHAKEIKASPLPIGWTWDDSGKLCARPGKLDTATLVSSDPLPKTCEPMCCWFDFPLLVLGWLLTALAVSLGAGFWFDLLGKVLQIRGTGAKISTETGRTEPDKG